jgi:hypothetical protein
MQSQFSNSQFHNSQFYFGCVGTPIQCEGIERGHRRIAEVGVSGSVNPRSIWGSIAKLGASLIPLPGAAIWGPLAVGAIESFL